MGSMYTGPRDEETDDRDAALLRDERERDERSARRDRLSWTIVIWVMAGALGLLSYDSGGAAIGAHREGRPWLYPAGVSTIALVGLLCLVGLAVWRRRRDRVSHRGPG
jgi:MYXO-CTERM domain-containing protein